ncbi:hypothetical protein C2G38_2083326 [Gigaspora rosea]|uniref:Uncharacterized protein n=1 Tax=Gigaspora rosea TaxID=44941 RepID=A0A397VEH5_9GLOM|nr:hypothetical protein C2G38_2083326 [Gigaspora rosea]
MNYGVKKILVQKKIHKSKTYLQKEETSEIQITRQKVYLYTIKRKNLDINTEAESILERKIVVRTKKTK